ncbi:MAG: ATP-grasp domain-containing protein [Rubrivivax sp.]
MKPRLGLLFGYDWDLDGFAAIPDAPHFDRAGFDLFSFPSNARLVGFDLDRFADRQARRGRRRGWAGVVSHHEQFGTLAAALVAERLGLPGATPESVLAAQHKLHARRVLQQVAPEANVGFGELNTHYGGTVPDGLGYPTFVKPVKAAFSVLARSVASQAELHAHTRFGKRESWVIRRLVEPFERIARHRLPQAGTAHRMLLETPLPLQTPQFNLDGWVFNGQTRALGVVDAIMYPGTQAFMRWEYPGCLPQTVQDRALDVARRFLAAIGYTHGFFNMEFFYDAASERLTVIEFNPRLASQFADLYRRVLGVDAHAMSVALALGRDPAVLPRSAPTAGVAGSQVYRLFSPTDPVHIPSPAQQSQMKAAFPDALLFTYPKGAHAIERDFKWLGSYRQGIVHLGAADWHDLRERTLRASALLGWTAPYADQLHGRTAAASLERGLSLPTHTGATT